MVLKAKNAIIPVVGIALALQAGGCKKDKTSKTDLLVGEWEITKLDGVEPEDYKYTFEFQADKDMKLCSEYLVNNTSNCYNGSWDWASSAEDEVDIDWTFGGDTYSISIHIDKLTKDVLEGELTSDGDTYDVVMEKQ